MYQNEYKPNNSDPFDCVNLKDHARISISVNAGVTIERAGRNRTSRYLGVTNSSWIRLEHLCQYYWPVSYGNGFRITVGTQ